MHSQLGLQIARAIGDRFTQVNALLVIGHAALDLGRRSEAVAMYREALDIRNELGQPNLATESLAGLARVALAQDDLVEALGYVETLLAYLEGGTPDGTDEPLRVYLTCYRALEAVHDPRAEPILTAAYMLMQERAAKIPDEPTRRMFLEDVPYHRELVAAWAESRGAAR
jgi:tetratricopeptide (TPR) repeat protein